MPCYSVDVQYVLIGNYGVGNFGDEALKEYFLSAYPQIRWQVLSAHPHEGEYPRLPAGLRSLFTPWWQTLGVIKRSDGVVFGGGTLFTDVESVQACLLWWWHALWAWMLRKNIYLAFQGIGPFKTKIGAWSARWVIHHSTFVSVRDVASLRRVQSWTVNLKVVQTFDPVFLLISSRKSEQRTQNMFCIIPRNNASDSFIVRAQKLVEQRSQGVFRILSFQPDDPAEQSVSTRLEKVTKGTITPVRTMDDLVRAFSGASFVLTQRFHGAIAALALGVSFEVVPQGDGDKLAALPPSQTAAECHALAQQGEEALRMALEGKIW